MYSLPDIGRASVPAFGSAKLKDSASLSSTPSIVIENSVNPCPASTVSSATSAKISLTMLFSASLHDGTLPVIVIDGAWSKGGW